MALSTPNSIDRLVVGEGVQPGTQRPSRSVIRRSTSPDGQKDLLDDVLRELIVSHHPTGQAVTGSPVPVVQLLERGRIVTRNELAQADVIVGFVRCTAPRPCHSEESHIWRARARLGRPITGWRCLR